MPYKDPERQRAYQAQWVRARRAEYLADKRCAVCGTTERLEIHHRDPKQKITHRVWSWSDERRAAELAKSVVLCHDHHLEQTRQQRQRRAALRHAIFLPIAA
jgi:hypothetical protein